MNIVRRICRTRRIARVLAGLAVVLAAAGATPAFASVPPEPGGTGGGPVPRAQIPVHSIAAAGMPGWQITLIAIGAALVAATLAVLADRVRTARRKPVTAAA